jgi:hypothetical protein
MRARATCSAPGAVRYMDGAESYPNRTRFAVRRVWGASCPERINAVSPLVTGRYGVGVAQSGRWDSNPRRPAWEAETTCGICAPYRHTHMNGDAVAARVLPGRCGTPTYPSRTRPGIRPTQPARLDVLAGRAGRARPPRPARRARAASRRRAADPSSRPGSSPHDSTLPRRGAHRRGPQLRARRLQPRLHDLAWTREALPVDRHAADLRRLGDLLELVPALPRRPLIPSSALSSLHAGLHP